MRKVNKCFTSHNVWNWKQTHNDFTFVASFFFSSLRLWDAGMRYPSMIHLHDSPCQNYNLCNFFSASLHKTKFIVVLFKEKRYVAKFDTAFDSRVCLPANRCLKISIDINWVFIQLFLGFIVTSNIKLQTDFTWPGALLHTCFTSQTRFIIHKSFESLACFF